MTVIDKGTRGAAKMTRVFFVLDQYGKFDTMCTSKRLANDICHYYGKIIEAEVVKIFDRLNQQCYYCEYCREGKYDEYCSKGYMIDLPFPCEYFKEIK